MTAYAWPCPWHDFGMQPGMSKRVLIVEPRTEQAERLNRAIQSEALVTVANSFDHARTLLTSERWDLLVTNVRLGMYNGLHLVHLAAMMQLDLRSIVYSSIDLLSLTEDAHRAGAFFERSDRVAAALPGYVRAVLPARDRRNATVLDRRRTFRGGRRASDMPATQAHSAC